MTSELEIASDQSGNSASNGPLGETTSLRGEIGLMPAMGWGLTCLMLVLALVVDGYERRGRDAICESSNHPESCGDFSKPSGNVW